MEAVTIGYTPLDLDKTYKELPAKVRNRKIQSDRDLEQDVSEICQILKDTSKFFL